MPGPRNDGRERRWSGTERLEGRTRPSRSVLVALVLASITLITLDVATDARLRAVLRPETSDAAVLVVAQRVSTITAADLILVVEDGRIVGRGNHDELLASNETYREIVESQLSAEEAAA